HNLRDLHSFPTRRSSDLPSTRESARTRSSSSSKTTPSVKVPNWSARKAAYSSSGARSRVATIARQAGAVAEIRRRGVVEKGIPKDRKSTRLNSSHDQISY